ncbi:MAG: hypothetical protein WD044_05395 [Dongiaceae bacterium]
MTRLNRLHGMVAALLGAAMLASAGATHAAMPQMADPSALPSSITLVTSDRCIQLEQQFDAVKDEHQTNPYLGLAQSHRDKGGYLCNADVDDEGEVTLEKALRLLGVEPDPLL